MARSRLLYVDRTPKEVKDTMKQKWEKNYVKCPKCGLQISGLLFTKKKVGDFNISFVKDDEVSPEQCYKVVDDYTAYHCPKCFEDITKDEATALKFLMGEIQLE